MKSGSKFWDKIAEKYALKPVPDEEVYRLKLELTQEYFHPETRVFEFGCGTGTTAIHHAPFVEQVHATDISPQMLRIARQNAAEAGVDNVFFELWDVNNDPVPDETFDVVLGMSILHLVEGLPLVLNKTNSLLKSGGVFVSSTTCLADRMGYMRPVIGLMRLLGKAPFVNFLKISDLEDQLQKAGFQIIHHWHPKGSDAVFLIAKKL